MDDDRAALRAEAADPATPPERLAELVFDRDCQSLVMGNPNTPWRTLSLFALVAPREFLANPVVPLLLLADPNLSRTLPTLTMRRLVQIDDPLALLFAKLHGWDWQVRDELAHHVVEVGEAGPLWEAEYVESLRQYDGYDYHNRDCHVLGRVLTWPLALPEWLLITLVTHREHTVREIAATSPAIPADVRAWFFSGDMAYLAGRDPADPIRRAIETTGRPFVPVTMRPLRRFLTCRAVPVEVLAQAARHTKPWLRRKAANHPCATPDLLRQLARDADEVVRHVVAHHPATPPDVLAGFANDATVEMRCIVARHSALPGEVLTQLAADPMPSVRRMVAQRADLSASLQAALAIDADAKVRAVTQPPPPSRNLVGWEERIQQVRAAIDGLPPEAILPYCATVQFGRIIRAIARDSQTPPHVLAALANHRNTQVRVDVAGNPATPDVTVQQLAQAENHVVALAALAHRLAQRPADDVILQHMQSHLFWLACQGMLKQLQQFRVRVPRDLLLTGSRNSFAWLVSIATAANTEPFAAYQHAFGWRTRVALVRNPATPPEIRAELLRDGNRYVRAAAKASLAADPGGDP